jgi:pimeloyl-ACP methyl ester carboxylesterase
MPYLNRPVDNLKISYTHHGQPSNPPFLLIHGWTCDSTDWMFTIPAIIPKYYVIAFDLRGHGHSSAPESITYTIRNLADDAVALLKHLNFSENVIVMGHSLGGIVASALTAIFPTIFRGLVVIDPLYWGTKTLWADLLPKWDEQQTGFTFMTVVFGKQLPVLWRYRWMWTWYNIRSHTTAPHVVTKTLQGAYAPDMLGQQEAHTELVKGRTIPRLAVYMAADNVTKEKELGDGDMDEIVHFPNAGHWLHQAKPDKFNDLLVKWLKRIGKA